MVSWTGSKTSPTSATQTAWQQQRMSLCGSLNRGGFRIKVSIPNKHLSFLTEGTKNTTVGAVETDLKKKEAQKFVSF